MDCREFEKFVHVYVDRELDDRDRGEIEGHLRECAPCRGQARFERWFRDNVKESLGANDVAMPADLTERIRAKLAKAPGPRSPGLGGVAGPVAAMLVLGLLLGYIWSLLPFGADGGPAGLGAAGAVASVGSLAAAPTAQATASVGATLAQRAHAAVAAAAPAPSGRPAASPPRRTAAPHRAPHEPARGDAEAASVSFGERDLPLQFASTDPERVRDFLQQRLHKPIVLPRFRGRASIVGGGAAEHDASAQVVYRYKDDDLYLHIRPHRDPTLPPQGIVVRQENGHRVAAWQRDGLTFSMTSRLDPVEMVRLVAAEISQPRRPIELQEGVASDPAVYGVTRPANFSEARPVSLEP